MSIVDPKACENNKALPFLGAGRENVVGTRRVPSLKQEPSGPRNGRARKHCACRSLLIGLALVVTMAGAASAETGDAQRRRITFVSSADGTQQPAWLILPETFDRTGPPVPLLVALHSWSAGMEQRQRRLEEAARQRGWIYLFPHFRGVNNRPEACGSPLAQQDILDAVAWTRRHYPVDARRIYLTGSSGGGHMAMLMAGRHPQLWAGVSAWVGISDLAAWHAKHAQTRYGAMLRACCGGAPGDSPEVDEQYGLRSPNTWIAGAVNVPLDLAAGIHDGHTGSVPIGQTIDAFNLVAREQGLPEVSPAEIGQLSRPDGRLANPLPSDLQPDEEFSRTIYLRRTAGKARVTIFEGGHERLEDAAVAWLSRQVKPAD